MSNNRDKPAVELNGVTRVFGSGDARVEALRGVDLTVDPGGMLFIVGPSGCGKTTLISIICGVLMPTDGSVETYGVSWPDLRDDQRTRRRGEMVGFIFQDFNLLSALTAQENVAAPLLIRGVDRAEAIDRAAGLLDAVGLGDRLDAAPSELSGGMAQRVAVARALVARPKLLVCDEPTANLDADTGQHVMEVIRDVGLGGGDDGPPRCVIVVTHDTRIFHFADRIEELEDGRIRPELTERTRRRAAESQREANEEAGTS